jgi:uncharacterized protein (TIGR00661 family)
MSPSEIKNKKILYAALDWGYGHVTRSIAIIQELTVNGNEIIIACNLEQENLFKSYFPALQYVFLEGYNFKFSGKGNWNLDLWKQRKSFFETINRENQFVENFCQKNNIDLIISDHRYGFFNTSLISIFITHQLHLPLSKWCFFIQKWHKKQLKNFNTIWVLDDEKSTLAGKLSKLISHNNIIYIGWKSRLSLLQNSVIKYDYLIVISGPKPYSEQFLYEILSKFDFTNKKAAILHPISIEITSPNNNFTLYKAENLKQTDQLFHESETIISRTGYSTLMDLKTLKKKAILFPTKGQKEQEYLQSFHHFDTMKPDEMQKTIEV